MSTSMSFQSIRIVVGAMYGLETAVWNFSHERKRLTDMSEQGRP
jgi:hypothetical protein